MSNNILNIAESSTLRFLLKRSFEDSGYTVIEAGSLTQGITELERNTQIDGVVFNWLALHTTEFETLLQLLDSSPFKTLPTVVIAVEADELALNWIKRREMGALTLLTQFEDVTSTMDSLLEDNSDVTAILPQTPRLQDPIHILFVDDSASSRAYYLRLLGKHHYQVTSAESVEHAWHILESNPPGSFDLVITDYYMPDENGHVLCRMIRKSPQMHDLLTAVMTGTYLDDAIDISLRAGAIECMFKEESDQLFVARVASMARMAKNKRTVQNERQRLSDILSSLGEGVYGIDTNGCIDFTNQAALQMLNYDHETDLLGCRAHDKLHYMDGRNNPVAAEDSYLEKTYRTAGVLNDWHTHFINSKGLPVPVSCTVVPLIVTGKHSGSVIVFRDIAKQQAMEKQLRWQASHDPLTNLCNRRYFEDLLEVERLRLTRKNGHSALLFLDLDRFKYINDTAGHQAGDKILQMVSELLQDRLRSSDTLARLGGDEFAVILRDIDLETLHDTADGYRQILSSLNYSNGEHEFKVHGSIGVAVIDGGSLSSSDIMANADIACHQAKADGRDQIHIYDNNSDVRFTMTEELGWANKLEYALDNDGFELVFEPILAINDIDFEHLPPDSSDLWATHHRYRNRLPTYIESLIRMKGEDGELIPPNLFLDSAERFGLMPQIDLWVIKNALGVLEEAHQLGLDFTLGINLSALTLDDQPVIQQISQLVQDMPVSARHLTIEITERSAITNMLAVKSFMDIINAFGCKFALDDFGAGFSSFDQLRHLPVKYVKIDGAYVSKMATDETDRTIVTSINDIAHSMGRQTVAEYVSNAGILRALQVCGVDYVQGYYIAEPLSKDALFVVYEDEPTIVAPAYRD